MGGIPVKKRRTEWQKVMAKTNHSQNIYRNVCKYVPTRASKTEFIVCGWAVSCCKNISPQKLHITVSNLLVNGNDVCNYCDRHLQIRDQSGLCWFDQTFHAIQFLAKFTVNLNHITCCIKCFHYTHNTVPVCMTSWQSLKSNAFSHAYSATYIAYDWSVSSILAYVCN